jgi:RNA polymerase sigma-70 factor (sigma-E family)
VDALMARADLEPGVPTDSEFAEFFHATWPRLYRTAYAVAGDPHAAEDALQTAYAKAFASWRRVRGADHPEAYVRRVVVNEILGTRRRSWWRREVLAPPPDAADPGDTTDVEVVDRDAMWAAVLALPPRQRAVVVLRYYEDLSEAEIAEVLGCSRGTVKSQASAALANLRRLAADLRDGDLS